MINYATWVFASTLRSTELVLSGPPCRSNRPAVFSRRGSRRAQPGTGSRDSHGDGLRRPHLVSLVPNRRRGKPILWTGFPLGVFSEKASLLSQGKAPLRPAFPSAGRFAPRPHPFSPKLSRFGAGSFVAHKPRQPRVLTIKWGVGALTPEPSPTKTGARSGPATRGGKPRLRSSRTL